MESGFYVPNPVGGIQHLINGMAVVAPYLTIIIPVNIYNFIETMDNVEGANAAGDDYSVREAQFADGICTMLSAIVGGVIPRIPYGLVMQVLRNPRQGSGIRLYPDDRPGTCRNFRAVYLPEQHGSGSGLCGDFPLVCSCYGCSGIQECPLKHYAAIGIAMVPPVADYLYSQITEQWGLQDIPQKCWRMERPDIMLKLQK